MGELLWKELIQLKSSDPGKNTEKEKGNFQIKVVFIQSYLWMFWEYIKKNTKFQFWEIVKETITLMSWGVARIFSRGGGEICLEFSTFSEEGLPQPKMPFLKQRKSRSIYFCIFIFHFRFWKNSIFNETQNYYWISPEFRIPPHEFCKIRTPLDLFCCIIYTLYGWIIIFKKKYFRKTRTPLASTGCVHYYFVWQALK